MFEEDSNNQNSVVKLMVFAITFLLARVFIFAEIDNYRLRLLGSLALASTTLIFSHLRKRKTEFEPEYISSVELKLSKHAIQTEVEKGDCEIIIGDSISLVKHGDR